MPADASKGSTPASSNAETTEDIFFSAFSLYSSSFKNLSASLEACFYGKPVIIFYYLNYLTYIIAKILVRIKYAGLINILAGGEVAPELIEFKFNPENVLKEADKFLKDEEYRENALKKISSVVSTLEDAGVDPFDAAAGIIYDKIIATIQ